MSAEPFTSTELEAIAAIARDMKDNIDREVGQMAAYNPESRLPVIVGILCSRIAILEWKLDRMASGRQ